MDPFGQHLPSNHVPIRRRRGMSAASALTAVLAAGLLAGCAPTDAAGPTASAAASDAPAVALPDSALGEHAQWVLDAINGEGEDLAAGATERLSAEMLDRISSEELVEILGQLEQQAPWTATNMQDGGDQAVITITPNSGDALDMQIGVDADELIAGLLFTPAAGERDPAASWSELEDAVSGFAADTTMTVTEVTDGVAGDRISAVGEDTSSPSGSMFKLYVLGAVVESVGAGDLAWEDSLTVTDDLKSLPSGELQDVDSGTEVTVQDAAEKMIAISDNTATDMLIDTVGHAAVEAAMDDMGHHDPSVNTPLLTTRALFQLGWGDGGAGGEAREDWDAAPDAADRQRVIDALPTGLLDVSAADLTSPVWQDGLDWFMTSDDLIAAHLALQEMAQTDAGAPVRDILSANGGLGELGDEWDYVAFKGGSSIGVLGGSWYLERADGRAFAITIQGSTDDPSALADQTTFFGQVQDAVALLESE